MTRYFRTVPEHVAPHRVAAGLRCNRCGVNTDLAGRWPTRDGWDQSDIVLHAAVGDTYPDADCRTVYEADLCPACFIGHVLPALRKAGVTVTVREADEPDPGEERP